MTTELNTNPLLDFSGLPRFDAIQPEHVQPAVDELIAANPGQAAQVKEKPQAIGWFVGQLMKQTGGKANPGTINQLLKSKLGVE